MRMIFPRLLGLVAMVASVLALSSCASPKEDWVSTFPETLVTTPRPGQNIKTVRSPDLVYALIVRDEGEQGDFKWYAVYLQKAHRYSLIGTFNAVENIVWNQGSSMVSFRGERAIESNVMQEAEYQYYPHDEILKSRTIKKKALPD